MTLSIEQVARGLNLPLRTIRRWIRQGRIPVNRSATDYTFDLEVIRRWANARQLEFIHEPRVENKNAGPVPESLLTAMQRGKIYREVRGSTADEVLLNAVDRIEFLNGSHKKRLVEKLLQREELMSTGVGKGFAIPHPRTPMEYGSLQAFITTCFLDHPVDFKAVDDQPVAVLFILCSPTVKTHLHLLSKLSFCLRDDAFGRFIMNKPDDDSLLRRIAEMETRMDHSL